MPEPNKDDGSSPEQDASRDGDAKSMIGAYGEWAASLVADPRELSLRRSEHTELDEWRDTARGTVEDLLARPELNGEIEVSTETVYEYDGLHVEELSWELGYGPPTRAVFLKPADAHGPLPGVLGLHDHGGFKYFGRRKIAATDRLDHPVIEQYRQRAYGDQPWANVLAKRGYAVLVPDAFPFGSRRVRLRNVSEDIRGETPVPTEDDPEAIDAYDDWAADHESTMAKSLFSAGTTWPGVFLNEDQYALDVLCDREDVDSDRIGCGGLSVGGLRTVFLGGMDDRIESAVCVGMMSTWEELVLNKSGVHTWMMFLPRCANYLDYSEILGLRAPKPTLVLNNRHDPLFTVQEMQRAEDILADVYELAGSPDSFRCSYYDGTHKFNAEMQSEAFDWFDETL